MALVYIAGYITRNDNHPSECETHFYHEKYGKYINLTDRGKLKVPSDHICQWLFFGFILFYTIKEKVCYKLLSNIFMLISVFHFFNMEKKYASIFANVVLKFFCKYGSHRSEKGPALKVLKLSLNDFVLFVYISEMIDCYINTSADVFQPSGGLFIKPSNCNVNLNQTLYSFTGNRLNKEFSGLCK